MEDSEILDLYWRRDGSAISETEEKYGALCGRIARNILGADEDAEECVNDVLHQAWNAIPPQRPDRLGAWLGKVTRNLALNQWSRNHTQKRYGGMTALLDELEDCVPAPGGVERELEDKELSAAIDRWLRSLPAPEAPVPGLKPGVVGQCRNLHQRRKGDFRYFLWDMQAWAHLRPRLS